MKWKAKATIYILPKDMGAFQIGNHVPLTKPTNPFAIQITGPVDEFDIQPVAPGNSEFTVTWKTGSKKS